MNQTEPSAPPPSAPRSRGSFAAWLVVAAVAVAVAAGSYFAWKWWSARWSQPVQAVAEAPAVPEAAPADDAELGDTDPLAREWARKASPDGAWAEFIAAPDLLRRLVAIVGAVSEGELPPALLSGLALKGDFEVVKRGKKLFIAPATHARFTPLSKAIESVNASTVGDAYAVLRPPIEVIWRGVGRPGRSFEQALDRAVALVVSTPEPRGELEVVEREKGVGYLYADPELEKLSAPQKQLLRMGPENARAVKAKLRELAHVLKLPSATAAAR